jgi:DNA-binding IclR family transcriptional regulator
MRVLDGIAADETRAEIPRRLDVPDSRVSSYVLTLIRLAKLSQSRQRSVPKEFTGRYK